MTAKPHKPPHPAVYLVLYLPYGAAGGYVTISLAWLLSHAGASVAAVAGLAGMVLLPNTWKVLWAPLIDTTLTSKTWYAIGIVLTGASLAAIGLMPLETGLLPAFGAMALTASLASTLSAMAAERFMAFDTPDHEKGRAAGWSQAGNLGGTGLGGGAGLWLAVHSGHPWTAGVTLALISAACMWPLVLLREPGRMKGASRTYFSVIAETGRDVWSLVRTRIGLLACFICLLPIGTGGVQQLWAAIAKDWGADADQVALAGGLLSGLVSIPGAVAGGYLADRMDRKLAYALFGVASALTAVAMAVGPRTPLAFLLFASLYNLIIGFCYGGYAAVTLEAIGKGAAVTKYNLVSSISNVPILVVTEIDGWAATQWGSGAMLWVEAGLGVVGVVFYVLVARSTRGLTWKKLFPGPGVV